MTPRKTRIGMVGLLALAASAPALAQSPSPGRAEMQFGSLILRPRFEIREIGVDSNIFNETGEPRDDFTATISPRLDVAFDPPWARAGYSTFVDFVYFHEFKNERSLNRGTEGRFELILDRFRPYVGGSIVDTHDRLNAELDVRAHRREGMLTAGVLMGLTTRTSLLLTVRRGWLTFDEDETFRGVRLADTLNSENRAYEGGLRFSLTPLTTLQIVASEQRDRFDLTASRDSRTIRITPSLEFDPSALVSGRLSIGYARFEPEDPALAPFRGLTMMGTLAYTVASTKLETRLERDVHYSYEALQPYYLTTGARVTLTQVVAGPFDVQGIAGRQRLAYRTLTDPATSPGEADRTDTVITWGGGVGYRLGDTARLGVTLEQTERRSPVTGHGFERRRIYGSLTYGF
jgi:hypothetical protein